MEQNKAAFAQRREALANDENGQDEAGFRVGRQMKTARGMALAGGRCP
ncbi:MAG: hypothetical protein LBQ62_07730 [Candidatus Accumulibacter sp.]|jgi:hypothetical protein|nr:hypothetical protein [Accumulibacter sp.]